jgi:hypothetical protein
MSWHIKDGSLKPPFNTVCAIHRVKNKAGSPWRGALDSRQLYRGEVLISMEGCSQELSRFLGQIQVWGDDVEVIVRLEFTSAAEDVPPILTARVDPSLKGKPISTCLATGRTQLLCLAR